MKIRKESAEISKLKKCVKNSPKSIQNLAIPAIEQLAFMVTEMTKLANEIEEKGWTEKYQNGANQSGIKKSAAADSYLSLSKNYNAVLKTVKELISDAGAGESEDEFLNYINS